MHFYTRTLRRSWSLWAILFALGTGSLPAQVITSITNNTGGLAGVAWLGLPGDQVTIWGNTFTTVSEVRFNGVLSPSFGTTTASTIQAIIPTGAASSTNFVSVKFTTGTNIMSPQQFKIPPNGPFVLNFSPDTGSPHTQITINGTRFTGVTSVLFNGITGSNLFKASDIQMTVYAPTGVSTGPITVLSNTFTHVTSSNFFVAPTITSFSPTNGRAGDNITVIGKNFTGATAVLFGALNAANYTVQNNTQLVAVVPNNALTGKITVSAPADTAVSTNNFKVVPAISGFTPNFGPVGTVVTITGTNLNEGSGPSGAPQVFFNGVASLTVTNPSFNQVFAVVPNGATSGKISVTTTNGSGTNDALFYLPPAISSFSPTTNPPGSRITIFGTNFLGTTSVVFSNNISSPSFFVTNNNILGVEVPAGIFTGPIRVTTPAGTATSVSNYFALPQINTLSTYSGPPGQQVLIFGNNFLGTTAVRFTAPGGTTNAVIEAINPTQLTVRVPTNAMTGPISVVAPAGAGTSMFDFTVLYSSLGVSIVASPSPATSGKLMTYTVTITNLGPYTANITVSNVLPASVTYSNASAGSTIGGITTASLGTIGVSATTSMTIFGVPTTPGIMITNVTTAVSGPQPSYTPIATVTYVEPPAILNAEFYSPASLLLSWPTTLSNYGLQFRTNIAVGNWSAVPTPPTINNGTNTVTENMSTESRFYRLQR